MLIISNALSNTADEGCLKVATSLVKRFKKAKKDIKIISYERECDLSDIHFSVNKLLLSRRLFSYIHKNNEPILYIPFPARTFATALRIFVLSLYSRKKLSVVSVMKYNTSAVSKFLLRLSGADFVVFSNDAYEFYAKILGKKRVIYLKTGVDTEKFVPVAADKKSELKQKYGFSDEPVILHVGHLNRGRNIGELLKIDEKYQILLVTSTLTKSEQDIELKKELLARPNIKIIDDYIPCIEEIYQLCDVYFFPVIEQGRCIDIPLSVMEAASCNNPIITTDYGEMKTFRGKDGFYHIDLFDETALNTVVEKALCGNTASRNSVAEYDWKFAVDYLLNQ